MSKATKGLLGGLIGYLIFTLTSHPKSRIHRKIPAKRIRRVSILPHVKIHHPDKDIHVHHWMSLSALYTVILALKPFRKSSFIHGFLLGGILQGLLYKDRFHIIKPIIKELEEVAHAVLPEKTEK